MFSEEFKKILKIVQKTGDRVIIFDPNRPEDSYAVMNLDSYAALVLKPENKKIVSKKIGKEKTIKSEYSGDQYRPKNSEQNIKKVSENKEINDAKNLTEEDLTARINREISMWKNKEESPYLNEEVAEKNKPKQAWQIPGQVKNKAQEII